MKTEVTTKQYKEYINGILHPIKMTRVCWEREGLCGVAIANFLTLKGIVWRTAHGITAQLWFYAEEKGKAIRELTNKELQKISPYFNRHVIWDLLDPEKSVHRKVSLGSTNPKMVAQAIRKEEKWLRRKN